MNRDHLIPTSLAESGSLGTNLRAVLQQVPDPRGKQGQDDRLGSILRLIVVSLLGGRRGVRAGFFFRRSLNKCQRSALGFVNGKTPCHATLAETLRAAQHLFSPRVRPQGPAIRLAFADESNRAVSGRQKQGSSPIFRMSLSLLLNRPDR
jgi:hypothetical protein